MRTSLMLQIGEGFIRELDFSRIWLRINADADDGGEDIVAEFKCDTRDFLEQCLVSRLTWATADPSDWPCRLPAIPA
jgi:hypothetical protein